jgi:hypothetical protein
MGYIDKIKNYFKQDPQDNRYTRSTLRAGGSGRVYDNTSPQMINSRNESLLTWRKAYIEHNNITTRPRNSLIRVYTDTMLDAHVKSQAEIRIKSAQQHDYKLVNEEGEEAEQTALLDSDWFEQIIEEAVNSALYGYSLMEVAGFRPDMNELDLRLIDRRYVKPEFSLVTTQPYSMQGVEYKAKPYSRYCFWVGQPNDLGVLLQASYWAIIKKESSKDWAKFNEMFGMPVRIGKTNVRDEELRNNMADMLKNMSSASWGVFDEDDLIEFVSASSNSSAGLNYENLIDKADAQISKVILGQTMLSDSGASYSQSKVHERVAQTIIESDQKRIERLVNGQILPKLTSLGWDFEGLTFQYVKQDEHTQLEKAEIVGKLSQAGYTIDPEQIEEEFGYRIMDTAKENANKIEDKYSK